MDQRLRDRTGPGTTLSENSTLLLSRRTPSPGPVTLSEVLLQDLRVERAHAQILHIGGWKKLESQKVSPEKLVADCRQVFGVAPGDVVIIPESWF